MNFQKISFLSFLICQIFLIENITAQKLKSIAHKHKNNKRPKNIILMIGDGMGTAQIYAGLTAKKDNLNLKRCTHIGFSQTNSSDSYITDSAAGATALSIGQKTYNGAIGVDKNKVPQKTILETVESKGLATGLVATCSITHATPASFIAHQPSRALDEDIAKDFLKTDVDVLIGGGRQFFEQRKDSLNLLIIMKKNNYQIVNSMNDLKKISKGKVAYLITDKDSLKISKFPKMSEGRGEYLSDAALKAIEILNNNDVKNKGFFLMVEGSQIDWGGHANDSDYIVKEMVDFDNCIGKVLDFAEKDGETLVIITADHETGGYALVGGNLEKGEVVGKFSTDYHTGVMVPVFAFGAGAEHFAGIYHNIEIYKKMMSLFRF